MENGFSSNESMKNIFQNETSMKILCDFRWINDDPKIHDAQKQMF